jgi:isopentenyl-diphosphate delta-isomerase
MNDTHVILVDSKDTEIGVEEKVRAHTGNGMLHRAVSILIFRTSKGHIETLLQKRSKDKLLWPGFWTNIICTHPRKGESYKETGARRLNEEMGIRVSPDSLIYGFQFEYQAQFSPEFAEHELDTVLFLSWDGTYKPDRKEVEDSKWISWEALMKEFQMHPHMYTPWFQQIAKDKKTEEYIQTI